MLLEDDPDTRDRAAGVDREILDLEATADRAAAAALAMDVDSRPSARCAPPYTSGASVSPGAAAKFSENAPPCTRTVSELKLPVTVTLPVAGEAVRWAPAPMSSPGSLKSTTDVAVAACAHDDRKPASRTSRPSRQAMRSKFPASTAPSLPVRQPRARSRTSGEGCSR